MNGFRGELGLCDSVVRTFFPYRNPSSLKQGMFGPQEKLKSQDVKGCLGW